MKNNLIVVKHNDLILKTAYKLTLLELRILLFAIAQMNPLQQNLPEKHVLDARKMAEIYNVPLHKFWQQISMASEKLFGRDIILHLSPDVKKMSKWVYDVELDSEFKTITFLFHRQVLEHLHAFENNFTSYQLENIVQMGSAYSIRFYEWSILHLKASKKDTATYRKTVAELKETLDLGTKYPILGDFRRRVLDAAQDEINKQTDVKFSYHIEKSGHAIKYIEFTARYNKRHKEDNKNASETLPVLENKPEEPKPQPNSDELPDFLNGEQPPMPDSVTPLPTSEEYNPNNYTPRKKATMEETNMPTYTATLEQPAKSHKSSNSFSEFNDPKRHNEELQTTELRDEEIDDCSDVLRLKFTIMNLDTLIKNFGGSPGEAQTSIVTMSQTTKAKAVARLEALFAQGMPNVQAFWEHDGKKTV